MAKNIVAAFASFIIPGLGQLCKQRYVSAILWFVGALLAYWLGWNFLGASHFGWAPGLIVNFLSAFHAAK